MLVLVHQEKKWVSCGEISLDLTRRPLCYRLFRFFAEAPAEGRSKQELMHYMYPISKNMCSSSRLLRSLDHNLLKLISRARGLARQQFGFGFDVDWFSYDDKTDKWYFYRPSLRLFLQNQPVESQKRVEGRRGIAQRRSEQLPYRIA